MWSEQAYIKASNPGNGDNFGQTVALYGHTLAVAANREGSASMGINSTPDDDGQDSGAAYVFTRDDAGIWSEEAYIKASNTGQSDQFGLSIALYGDTLAVGHLSKKVLQPGSTQYPITMLQVQAQHMFFSRQ